MQHKAAFHLDLLCLQKYAFRGSPPRKGINSYYTVYIHFPNIPNVEKVHGKKSLGATSWPCYMYIQIPAA